MHRILPLLCCLALTAYAAEPLHVCATIPDLGDLVRAVGGDRVEVTVFARGGDDPHFVDPRPGFAKALARADLLVSIGMELEIGWLPVVVTQARNPRLATGQPGWFEAGSAIRPMDVPSGPVDRSHGDVHGAGNPHFLTDPVCGVQVAKALAQRLGELAPDQAATFAANQRAFALDVAGRLLGATVVKRVGADAVVAALEHDALAAVIGDGADLGGWLGLMKPSAGALVVADHDLWPYFCRRFGITVAAFLEPKPGIPPTTRHLADVVTVIKGRGVRAIITVPYFDPRHARFVADQTGLPIVILAHQAGAVDGVTSWLDLIDHNVKALAAALGAGK